MSRPLKIWTIAFAGFAFGMGGMAMWKHTARISSFAPKSRDVASAGRQPVMGKHLSIVQVSVQAPGGIPDSETQEVTLVGRVRLNQAINSDLNFKWELPEGVHVVDGQIEDSWSQIASGQTAETHITLTGFSRESLRLVALHGFVRSGDEEFGNSASLTSRPEDSYEILATGFQKTSTKKSPPLSGPITR